MLNVLLHCADISNVVKPNELCVKWASRVLEEFFNQGDRERARGLPISPMMDRETTSVGLSQINFIEFVIAPLFVHFATIFPSMDDQLRRLVDNRRHYQRVYEDELRASTESDGVDRSVERDNLRARFRTLAEKHALHRFLIVREGDDDDDLIRAVFARDHPRSPPRSHAKRRVDF
jgi:cAMP-specific phosphodiesterase 4